MLLIGMPITHRYGRNWTLSGLELHCRILAQKDFPGLLISNRKLHSN